MRARSALIATAMAALVIVPSAAARPGTQARSTAARCAFEPGLSCPAPATRTWTLSGGLADADAERGAIVVADLEFTGVAGRLARALRRADDAEVRVTAATRLVAEGVDGSRTLAPDELWAAVEAGAVADVAVTGRLARGSRWDDDLPAVAASEVVVTLDESWEDVPDDGLAEDPGDAEEDAPALDL